MQLTKFLLVLIFAVLAAACAHAPQEITSSASGDVLTGIKATATDVGEPFDGRVDSSTDLDDLLKTARGNGELGLHRGHAPIQSVLEQFLGITHDEMHFLMEKENLNLAGICKRFGFKPENLVETLTNSFEPYLIEAVENLVIPPAEFERWKSRVRQQFYKRVHWDGQS